MQSLIMAMTSAMTVVAKQRKPTLAEYIADMHKQYRIGQVTSGHKKKTKKVTNEFVSCVGHFGANGEK